MRLVVMVVSLACASACLQYVCCDEATSQYSYCAANYAATGLWSDLQAACSGAHQPRLAEGDALYHRSHAAAHRWQLLQGGQQDMLVVGENAIYIVGDDDGYRGYCGGCTTGRSLRRLAVLAQLKLRSEHTSCTNRGDSGVKFCQLCAAAATVCTEEQEGLYLKCYENYDLSIPLDECTDVGSNGGYWPPYLRDPSTATSHS